MRRQLTKSPYGNLVLKQLIGKGSYGQIYKAYAQAQKKEYAIKIISSDSQSDSLVNIERQIKILMSCNHKNIVKCHSVEIIDDMVWIVMDYYSKGSLADVMIRQKRTFNQDQIKVIVNDIVDALVYLHQKNIIHRDIKAANILVDDNGEIKVADFGVSTLISQSHKHTRTGSPLWMSPQLLSNSHYSFKTDIWSLGITSLQLAQGVPPYSHQHPYRAIFSIQAHPPHSLSQPFKWSPQFNNFVSKCLTFEQSKRPSAKDLQKHEFLIKKQSYRVFSVKNQILNRMNVGHIKPQLQKQQIFGTVILHDQHFPSVWQKKQHSFLPDQNSMIQSNVYGTFKIKNQQKKQPNIPLSLLAQITKALPQESLQKIQYGQESIQGLYAEMEQQIRKIRKKYLTKIRAIQRRQMLTFSSQLKKAKQKAVVLSNINSISQQSLQ